MLLAVLVFTAAAPASVQQLEPSSRPRRTAQIAFVSKELRRPVPVELAENLIVFRARAENSDVWAILDNGAGSSLIDEGVARRLGISVSAPIGEFKTATGQLERRATSFFSFSIPGMLTATSPLPATDLSFASKVLGRPIGLIIGRDFFSNLTFLIRPSRNTFELGPSGSVKIPQGLPGVDVGGPIMKSPSKSMASPSLYRWILATMARLH